jgi:hypothetical protein
MGRRRGRGEKAVFRRGGGLRVGGITAGYDELGRRGRRYVCRRTKADVLEKLARQRVAVSPGTLRGPTRVSLADFLRHWLEHTLDTYSHTAPATYRGRRCPGQGASGA